MTTTRDELPDLLRRRFDVVDAKDLDGFLGLHTDDARLVFGGRPPVVGKAEAAEQVQAFWAAIGSLRHDVERCEVVGSTAYVESNIEYERLDGRVVQVPCCDVFELRGDLIAETRAYLDQGPVWAEE